MDTINLELENRIATIMLSRPEKRNALSPQMISEIHQAIDKISGMDDVRLLIFKARGAAFCAGADLNYLQQMQKYSYEENLEDSSALKDLFYRIYTLPKIVIAQVQGPALAGGCGLVTVCDFAFATRKASFGFTEVRIGFIPAIVMMFLLRKIKEGSVRSLVLSGELIGAPEAHSMGLINGIAEDEVQLESMTSEFVQRVLKTNSFEAMKTTKEMLTRFNQDKLKADLNYAAEMNARSRNTDDCKRGLAAFLNKEKVLW